MISPAIDAFTVTLDASRPDVRLLPAGKFRAVDGRPKNLPNWKIDATLAARVISRVAARADQRVVDYEHQTLHAAKNGQPAPASGWFKHLEWREGDGLYTTDLSWTDRASGMIAAKEYRYISPVFVYDKKTGDILDILHAGITNNAGLDGLTDLAALSAQFGSVESYGIEACMTKLGDTLRQLMADKNISSAQLGSAAGIESGTVDQILRGDIARPPDRRLRGFARVLGVSFQSLIDLLPDELKQETKMQKLTALLGLADDADDKAVEATIAALTAKAGQVDALTTEVAALKSQSPDPAQFVPAETVKALQTQVATLTATLHGQAVDELIKTGLADGRILPAMETWARDLGKKNVADLKSYIDNASPVAALNGTQTNGKKPEGGGEGGLNDSELAVCKQMGMSAEDYKKSKAESATAA